MSSTSAPFRFIVSDLVGEPGRRRHEHVDAFVAWGVDLSRTDPEEPMFADLRLEGVGGGVYVTGTVGASIVHTCHRCTRTWSERMEIGLGELIGTEDGTDYRLDGEVADVEPLVRDAVVLALPLVPTCSPDCLGLCAVCGADLNTGACPGHDEEPESPFSPLRDMLEL